jgi:hypothetical protein
MKMNPPEKPDPTGNRSRLLVYAPQLGLSILENRTRSRPGPPEQHIWTYCFDRPEADTETLLPPTGVRVTTSKSSAEVSWKGSSSKTVTHYVVCRGTGEQPWTVDYQEVARIDARQTAYRDEGLRPGTVYYCAVCTPTEGV